jgi:enoyl-CoA hydratase/carnithine racemase
VIRVERRGAVAIVVLDRAAKRNALTPEMLRLLEQHIGSVTTRDAGALLVTGEGPAFCGGFDLKLCLEREGTLRELLEGLSRVIDLLRSLPVPVVAGAQGAAIAGGCALLGGCDFIITDAAAKLGYPVTPLGISPAVSASFMRHLVGDGAARERLLDPALVDGREAARIGLVHEVVDTPDAVLGRAIKVATDLAAKPRGAMAATRRWIREIEDAHPPNAAERGLNASLSLVSSEEQRSRLAALVHRM